MNRAVQGGHLEILIWLKGKGHEWDEDTFTGAANGGHLGLLKRLRELGCPINPLIACSVAALGGHLEVLKWLREIGCEWDEEVCTNAVYSKSFEMLKWASENGCHWDWKRGTTDAIARAGFIDLLKWARGRSSPWLDQTTPEPFTCRGAAQGGHLELLKW